MNNAGIGDPTPAEEETTLRFSHVLDVNVIALFHLCQLAGACMLAKREGAIVNVASIFGLVGAYPIHHAAYCASKGAVVNLTRELGAHWAGRGVRVNALAPRWFESEMTADMWSDPKALRHVERGAPAGRRGRPNELDAALLFLAGPGSSYVNGQVLAVDGGWTAR